MTLNDEAAHDFDELCWASLCFRLISLEEYHRRMLVRDMLASNDCPELEIPADVLDRLDGVEVEPHSDFAEDSAIDARIGEMVGTDRSVSGSASTDRDETRRRASARPPPFVEFIPYRVLRKPWNFHPHDDDYWPSIPHGHLNGGRLPKMNPYIGKAFRAREDEVIGLRLNKEEMVRLWNFQPFRDVCLAAIDYYSMMYPTYNFSVANPRRLPRPSSRYSNWRRYL